MRTQADAQKSQQPTNPHVTGKAYRLLLRIRRSFTMLLTLATPRRQADLTARVRAEFLEMPGLRLTLAQVSKLCGASSKDCQRVLDELIGDTILCRIGDVYVRSDSGRRCA
jgi:hypothetical protein